MKWNVPQNDDEVPLMRESTKTIVWGRRLVSRSTQIPSVQGWRLICEYQYKTSHLLQHLLLRDFYDARALFDTISFISYPAIIL